MSKRCYACLLPFKYGHLFTEKVIAERNQTSRLLTFCYVRTNCYNITACHYTSPSLMCCHVMQMPTALLFQNNTRNEAMVYLNNTLIKTECTWAIQIHSVLDWYLNERHYCAKNMVFRNWDPVNRIMNEILEREMVCGICMVIDLNEQRM